MAVSRVMTFAMYILDIFIIIIIIIIIIITIIIIIIIRFYLTHPLHMALQSNIIFIQYSHLHT